ncbi:MAG: SURF1 family protein [Burkholderiaceae bacterium]|nr:SURF1 family protein [Burkholderiaceae bacterium]
MTAAVKYWLAVTTGIILTAIACWAAYWQDQRADSKRLREAQRQAAKAAPVINLNIQYPTPNDAWRRAKVIGHFLPAKAIYLDNRLYKSQPGREVLMPIEAANSKQIVLINRGWVAQPAAQRMHIPQVSTPASLIELEGVLVRDLPHYSGWGDHYNASLPNIWPNLNLKAYQQASGFPQIEWIMLQTSPADDGLIRDWPQPASEISKHLGYRFQWLLIALITASLTLYFGISSWRKKN